MIHSSHRFHGRSSLRFVYRQGRVVHGKLLALRFVRNPRERTYRAAVVVSRKVSKSAVVRNRIRRRIFELVRRESGMLNGPYDLVFNAPSADLADADSATVQRAVHDLLDTAGLLKPGQTGANRDIVEAKER
jgi:ribonuclease P protein component